MEDYYEYLDSNGVTTLYKLIKDDTVALIDSYSVTINGITTNLDNHANNADIHTPIATIEGMIDTAVGSLNYATPDYVDTKVADLVNSSPETLDTLKELSDALGNDSNFATTVANQIGSKADKDSVYTKQETDTLLEGKANSVHNHVVSDITDFPTIPTKVSELTNDSGYITSVSWEDVTSKPELSQVAISGSYSDLSGAPTIPTKTSQLINDSGFLTSSNGLITSVNWSDITNKPNFSTVATSGSYSDLSNKPTIPNVYNKTLTIQKNGTNVATFTSNSNTDVTADITVPTKVSELSNDSGFITGISWDKVTNKPILATVAISGSYTDLSNTPTIPTKVSQLENDMGFGTGGNTSDCVHKTGNETINGIKTFTSGPWVTNNATTNGYSIKLNAIARNEVPSQLYHATFRAYDKNDKILGEYCVEKSTTGSSLLNMNVRSEDSNGNQLSESVYLNMSNDGSAVRFHPSSNNKVDLGTFNQKWAKIYSDDVVHTSGNETIEGTKKFTADITRKNTSVDITATPTSDMYAHINFTDKNDKTVAYIQYAQKTKGVDYIGLRVRDKNSETWGVQLNTNKEFVPLGNNSYSLGSVTNKWKNVYATTFNGNLKGNADTATSANDPNAVHKTGDETINGNKTFTETIRKKNSALDRQVNPSSNQFNSFLFTDKNNAVMGYLEHIQTTSGVNAMGLYAKDKNNATHGFQVTSEDNVIPLGNGVVNLGLSGAKWKNVYATTFNGNLVGGITLNQSSLKMTVKDSNSETTRTNDVILANSSNSSYGINVAFGGSGNTVVGAGESYTAQLNELAGNSAENLFLIADGHIYFKPGANTFANAKTITLSSAAELSGLAKVTSTSFVGVLTGNVTGNATSATKASYLDNYSHPGGNKIYLDWDVQKESYVGLKVDNTTMGGLITTKNIGSQAANSATYATTQATSDNSTKIATTAWVRTYVNSVVGSGSIGASISAYYSNATTLTAEGNSSSSGGSYPSDYSDYINISPTVGTIYTGSQLFGTLNASASGSTHSYSPGSTVYQTTAKATANFSGAFSSSAKYLCTTANAVKFRAYVSQGSTTAMGSPSVVNNSSAKSIFIRVQ